MHGFEQSVELTLPPLSVFYLRCRRKKPQPKPAVAELEIGRGQGAARGAQGAYMQGR